MQMKGRSTFAAGAAAALVVTTGALLPLAHARTPLDTVHLSDVDSQALTWQHTRSLSKTDKGTLPDVELPTLPVPEEDNGRGFRTDETTPEPAPTPTPKPAPTPTPEPAPAQKPSAQPSSHAATSSRGAPGIGLEWQPNKTR